MLSTSVRSGSCQGTICKLRVGGANAVPLLKTIVPLDLSGPLGTTPSKCTLQYKHRSLEDTSAVWAGHTPCLNFDGAPFCPIRWFPGKGWFGGGGMLEGTWTCSICTCKNRQQRSDTDTSCIGGVASCIGGAASCIGVWLCASWGVASHLSHAQYLNGWSLIWRLCDWMVM